jgi:DNA polymerase-4
VGRRLRRNRLRGRRVTLTVRFSDFSALTRHKASADPLRSGKEIYQLAHRLWDSMGNERPVRLLGVTVSNLQRASNQFSLLPGEDKWDALWGAVDRVNDKYGDFTLTWGSLYQSPQ